MSVWPAQLDNRHTPVSNAALLSPARNTTRYARPLGMVATCAQSPPKILPSTSPSKPELPQLSTLGQSPVKALVFPDYLSNPHLSEASLRTPLVSRMPTECRALSPRHRVPTRRPKREDTSSRTTQVPDSAGPTAVCGPGLCPPGESRGPRQSQDRP